MVNVALTIRMDRSRPVISGPERRVILSYAPDRESGAGLAALLALDDKLAETLRSTTEPMLGQIRLQWWHDAVLALEAGPAPAEPVLQAIRAEVIDRGVAASLVAEAVMAWQVLLQEQLDEQALGQYAVRGRALFAAAGALMQAGSADPLAAAGEGVALADLALRLSDPAEAEAARRMATERLATATAVRWSRNGRALGAMSHLAAMELDGVPPGSPRRVWRALRHRITGR